MSSDWARPPRIVGHRGSPDTAPENTLAGLLAAVEAGVRAVEFDVRLTRDGEAVLMHDPACGRTVSGEGFVDEMSLADLRARDAGAWHSPRFAGERVPTLREALAALPRDVLLDVELKADAENAELLPDKVGALLAEAGAGARALVTSFDPELADAYARRFGGAAGMILPFEPDADLLASFPRLRHLALAYEAATPDALALAQKAEVAVHAWTVNDVATAQALLARGVASVITDRPGRLLAALPPAGPAR